jgi:hypothetical protein
MKKGLKILALASLVGLGALTTNNSRKKTIEGEIVSVDYITSYYGDRGYVMDRAVECKVKDSKDGEIYWITEGRNGNISFESFWNGFEKGDCGTFDIYERDFLLKRKGIPEYVIKNKKSCSENSEELYNKK